MKKLIAFLLTMVLCLNLVGCGTKYEDTNGEDNYTLQTITNENIINLESGSSGLSYKELDLGFFHSSEYSSKNFNGVEQIFRTNYFMKSHVNVYVGHLNVTKGNFKLVVINNDEIIQEIPVGAFNETYSFEALTGTFSIHVAGESAAFEFHIDVH